RYMIAIGGKRIRPRLCLLAYSLLRDTLDDGILQPAVALEVFHTFTLIHDDIMDKSPLRRGRDTVWVKWNDDTAILSGDVMSIESYRRLAYAPKEYLDEVLMLFNETAAQVCEGQQYDMEFESRSGVSMDEYMQMIGLKTGVLIAASAKMGAIIGGASTDMADRLYDFGYLVGLAFQVADDYLDTYGDEKVFGKPIGGDILNAKKSWLLTKAQELAADRQAGTSATIPSSADLERAIALPAGTPEQKAAKITAVRDIYTALGVDTIAREEIRRLSDEALSRIEGIDPDGRLAAFADSLTARAR
ncbi:MAG: polyprenyl synthetase family protein, partial [Bacteroidales bacterium]|nr:polyprenyl synthetase family protein [Bacteroidales bacterium]